MEYYLAIDVGASGGRHILGWLEEGRLRSEEVCRFHNGTVRRGGRLCWDRDALYESILRGLKRCGELGKIPVSVGIDTWGVDFVLLDAAGGVIGDTVAYRDNRTDGMDAEVFARMPETELYRRTGIQTQPFNTIFQLMALSQSGGGLPPEAKTLLLTPDYLHYRLCGVAKTEYTIASTTGLLNAESRNWDPDVLNAMGFPAGIFTEIVPPGTVLGNLLPEVARRVGFDAQVVAPCGHDTAAAVLAVPSQAEDTLYISSGTWSLLGVERQKPDCSPESLAAGFTNEGGYGGRYRYLRNIMGLWMIQSLRKNLGGLYSFDQLCELARRTDIDSIVDCNDNRFFAPENMVNELQLCCRQSGQRVPHEPGELAAVVYNSLAVCYRDTIRALESRTGVTYPAVHIVGGGSNDGCLNELTARYTGKPVLAGPKEATALGNLLAQMIARGRLAGLQAARACVMASIN
jgi:rhamnulokinase